jgi:2-oxo-3-hexenedioate decarboxylase
VLRTPQTETKGEPVNAQQSTRTHKDVAAAANQLLVAEGERRDRPPLTDDWADLDMTTAYAIQSKTLELRLQRGEKVVGLKLGLTSRSKQLQMNVDSPITAWLTDAMVLSPGSPIPRDQMIHPRAEPEIVFVMGRRLAGPGVTADEALAAVGRVHAGIEIIDSRYTDFRFRLPDVVADNASSAFFVVSVQGTPPRDLDLALEACNLEVDGRVVATATGAAVQGHPAEALASAANALAERGVAIEAGWIVLTGGMTDAVPAPAGSDISARFGHLGTITLDG